MDGFSFPELFNQQVLVRNAVASVLLVFVVLLARSLALRFVRRSEWASEPLQLRWTVQVRWASLAIVALGLVVVWATELRTVALSMAALAVAIVLATKELILCISGSVLRAASSGFSVGDRIEIAGIRGDVVDMGALTTTVLEVGPGHRRTGRAVVVPNSLLLNTPFTNETFTDDFVLHMIVVPLGETRNWQEAEERLLAVANEVCAPFIEEARRYMNKTARRLGVTKISVDPLVNLQAPEAGKFNLLLRIPTRAYDKGQVEQQILRSFFRLQTPAASLSG